MPVDVIVPPLSQTMDSLVLVEWRHQSGQLVTKGEPLFVVETDKATLEVEAPASGILQEVLAQAGTEVKVRAKIASILVPEESVPAETAAALGPAATLREAQPITQHGAGADSVAGRKDRILASPRARRLAAGEAVDLRELRASGPRGMIVSRDVLAYLEARPRQPRVSPLAQRVAAGLGVDVTGLASGRPGQAITRADVESLAAAARAEAAAEPAPPASAGGAPVPAPVAAPPGEPGLAAEAAPAGRRVVLSNLRRTIAQRLHASQQATAAVTLNREVNATELVELRQRILADLPPGAVRPSLTDFLAFVLARSLLAHRELNGVARGETWELIEDVHLALAVDTERGLLAPVIRSAQRKGLLILAAERSDLVGRTRAGRARPEELSGGTFTLSNLGPLGVDAFTPIINPPQIAILGIGRLRTVPAFAAGQVIPAQMMVLSLTFDHRAVDGAPAARLLQDLALWIEKPHMIWLR